MMNAYALDPVASASPHQQLRAPSGALHRRFGARILLGINMAAGMTTAAAAQPAAPPLSSYLPASVPDDHTIRIQGAGSWSRLRWFHEIARDVGLGRASQYGGGVIRFTTMAQGSIGPATIVEIAEGSPGEVVIRQIEAHRRTDEEGWAATVNLIEKRGGNFDLLSRQLVRRLTTEAELSSTLKEPLSLPVCAHPQWRAIEVESRSLLPLSLARWASCRRNDPVLALEAEVRAMVEEARKAPAPPLQ